MKDYYELLELSKNASEDMIKKVFRILIKKNHPDLFEGEEKLKAEEKVKQLNEAYEVLTNKESREKYDAELEEYKQKDENIIQTLIEENEYLKNVIQEKNSMIREFLTELNIDTKNNEYILEDDYEYKNENIVKDKEQNYDYSLYKRSERIKKIIYMILIIICGAIVLNIVTGINIFSIFIEIFKTMF